MGLDHEALATIAKDFLQKNLTAINAVPSDAAIAAPLMAIILLEDYGDSSARLVLTELSAHPHYGGSAVKAVRAIQTRHP